MDKQSCLQIYKTYKNAKQECQNDGKEKKISDISINFKFSDK
jgi:hypothetical protein